MLKDLESELGFFRPGLKEYYMSRGQGHFRMDIGASGVTMSFYPGAQTVPTRKFKLA